MPTYFFDTNPLVYWYTDTLPTAARWVEAITRKTKPAPRLVTSALTITEEGSALHQLWRGKRIGTTRLNMGLRLSERHIGGLFEIVELQSPQTFWDARRLIEKYGNGRPAGLETQDAIQLVLARNVYSALAPKEQNMFWIITSDIRMGLIARAEGYQTLDPLHDPVP